MRLCLVMALILYAKSSNWFSHNDSVSNLVPYRDDCYCRTIEFMFIEIEDCALKNIALLFIVYCN